MNRRSVLWMLVGGSAALQVQTMFAAGSSPGRVNLSLPAVFGAGGVVMQEYTIEAFASRVGEVFAFHHRADGTDTPVLLELIEVNGSPHGARSAGRQPFSLLFALRSADPTSESTLHLRHAGFEQCAWFINRVVAPNRDAGKAYYEAVFG